MSLNLPSPQAVIAEFLGTFVFVFVACGAVLTSQLFEDVGAVGVGLAVGLTFAAMIYATSAISGGHLNPVITLSLWFSQKINTLEAVFYILAQVLAGFTAAFCLLFVFGPRSFDLYFGGPVISVETTLQGALGAEAILSSALVFAYFATMVDKRGSGSFGPMIVGFVMVAAVILAGPISGGVVNPARAIGPLVTAGHFDSLMVFIIGPLIGSLIGFIYPLIFLPSKKKK